MNRLENGIRVGIIMGSDSDLKIMQKAGQALARLGLKFDEDYEERIVSAHRTPEWMARYAKHAELQGRQVIIAGAGGSAHLPGMIASETNIPVLGVAITCSPDTMNRALGSMIGMPEGKPLATFQGESGAFNAGLFACRILALSDPAIRATYRQYDIAMASDVMSKDSTLRSLGAQAYLRANPTL